MRIPSCSEEAQEREMCQMKSWSEGQVAISQGRDAVVKGVQGDMVPVDEKEEYCRAEISEVTGHCKECVRVRRRLNISGSLLGLLLQRRIAGWRINFCAVSG
jgi:hypothetical protein